MRDGEGREEGGKEGGGRWQGGGREARRGIILRLSEGRVSSI